MRVKRLRFGLENVLFYSLYDYLVVKTESRNLFLPDGVDTRFRYGSLKFEAILQILSLEVFGNFGGIPSESVTPQGVQLCGFLYNAIADPTTHIIND